MGDNNPLREATNDGEEKQSVRRLNRHPVLAFFVFVGAIVIAQVWASTILEFARSQVFGYGKEQQRLQSGAATTHQYRPHRAFCRVSSPYRTDPGHCCLYFVRGIANERR